MSGNKLGGKLKWMLIELLIYAGAVFYLFPIYIIVTMSFKTKAEFADNAFRLPKSLFLDNIVEAWGKMHYFVGFFNSVQLTFFSLIGILICASAAAYGIARANSRLYNGFLIYFLTGFMVPFQMLLVPIYKLLKELGLINTKPGMILVFISTSIPFAVFLVTGFIKGVPKELDESAYIDGASKFDIFSRIVFPLLVPVLTTLTILNAMFIWNEFLLPLIYLQGEANRTIMTTLFAFKTSQYTTNWTLLAPAMMLTLLPLVILFLFLQKFIIKGMISGAVKG